MSLESSLLSSLAQKLGDLLVDEVKLLKGVEDQVQSMQRELKWIGSYLRDVDEGQEESSHILRTRIKEIRNITFKAEDVIDSFIFLEDRRRRKSFLKRYVFSFPNYLVQRHQIASEIKAINTMIQENKQMFETYHVSGRNEQIPRRRPQGNPENIDKYVVGLVDDVRTLVNKLTTEKHQERVLCIAGMGGSGKTTLAKELYNHKTIKQHFKRAWVSISQEWSVDHILVQILRQVTDQDKKSDETRSSEELVAEATGQKKKWDETRSFEDWSSEELVAEVHKHLKQNLYLIVLDDVWKKEALKSLLPAFPVRNEGSKIIITTRILDVVQVPGLSSFIHEPRRLDNVESWDLLTKIVLNQWQTVNICQLIGDFERLGKEMLEKCAGLPLAIIALGGILCWKYTIEEWNKISDTVSAKVMEGGGTQEYDTVKNVLALSYNELPNDLKPCFLYFALFPEDFVIPVGKLLRMWISEGFIPNEQCREQETLEDVARQFLDELIQRNVIQIESRNYKGKVKTVRIHDLIRELCIEKAKERDFLEIFPLQSSAAQTQIQGGTTTQARRISLHSSSSDTCIPSQAQNSNIRSLFVFQLGTRERRLNLADVHRNFRLLKVLKIMISYSYVSAGGLVLPTEMGNLIHLTYLGIEVPLFVILPESIVNLRSLLTLDCRDCILSFKEGRKIWWKMYRVRHLLLDNLEVPHGILKFSAYRSLQTLLGVQGGNWMLEEMSTLSPTVKRLGIQNISTKEQLEAVFQCPSFKAGHLHTLNLRWSCSFVLQNKELSFICHGLRKLDLRGPIGEEDSFPSNLFPPSLEKLTLVNSQLKSIKTMATIGKLPNLRHLYLGSHSFEGTNWICSRGEFLQLEQLKIFYCPNLNEWRVEKGAMPRLNTLDIIACPRLIRLPELGNDVVVYHG